MPASVTRTVRTTTDLPPLLGEQGGRLASIISVICLFHGDLPVSSSRGSVMEGMMHPRDSQGRGRIAQASIAAKEVVPATSP